MKNLPKEVAEARLRDVFSKKGEITDAKLLRSRYYYYYIQSLVISQLSFVTLLSF